MFRAARDADYSAVAEEAREVRKKLQSRRRGDSGPELEASVSRLRNRLIEIVAMDFFDALGRQTAEGLVSDLERAVHLQDQGNKANAPGDYKGRVWVTRKGIHVDRLASAWMIRRFIDQQAKFKYVPPRGYQPQKDEVRFDMFDAEFTHEGDRCTAEVLMAGFAPKASALRPIVEIVHDIDLKDRKYERSQTAGVEALITGICMRARDDEERLERGSALFDDLLEFFSRRSR